MIKSLMKNMFIVEDEQETINKEKIHNFIKLLCIAERTSDKGLYTRIIKETREIAEDYIEKGNPLGYKLIAEWYISQKSIDKALVYHILAARNNFEGSKDVIRRFSKIGKKDSFHALLLAESFFIIGDDDEGDKWLNRAKELGFKASDQGMRMRIRGNTRKLSSADNIAGVIDSFNIRLFRSYIFDYSDLDKSCHKKWISFCRGYSFAKGADLYIDEDRKTIKLSHDYRERVLVDIVDINDSNKSKTVRLSISSMDNTVEALNTLLSGTIVIVDYTDCPDCDAQESFDTLAGACFALKGGLDREGENIFVFGPKLKEYDGDASHFEATA